MALLLIEGIIHLKIFFALDLIYIEMRGISQDPGKQIFWDEGGFVKTPYFCNVFWDLFAYNFCLKTDLLFKLFLSYDCLGLSIHGA